MGLGDLGELGDIGAIVGSVVGIGISAIILLTFAPAIVGDIDGFSLAGTDRCELSVGDRARWVLKAPSTATNGEEAWAEFRSGTTGYSVVNLATGATFCTGGLTTTDKVFTPKGTPVVIATDAQVPGAWKKANASLTALSGGTRAAAVQRTAILVPAGAIGFLGGARFISWRLRPSPSAPR